MAPDLYLLVLVKILLLPQLLPVLFTPSTINITATSTTTTTTTTNTKNKKCIRGRKIRIKWHLKDIWYLKSFLCKFVSVMANVFLIWEAAVIFKEIGGWLFLKWKQIIAESINMNKLRASWKMFCGGY